MVHIKDTLIGGATIGIIETVPHAVQDMDISNPNVLQIVIQIIAAAATLFKLFQKSKKVTN